MQNKLKVNSGTSGVVLAVRVIPRAKKNTVDGIMADGTLKIRLAAPPVEGKANQALVRFLVEILDIPASQIKIIAGQTGRRKRVLISGMDAEVALSKIQAYLDSRD